MQKHLQISAQSIEIEGKQVMVIPADDYRILLEKADMLNDVAAYDRPKAALAAGYGELVPAVVAGAILDGESPVRVRRQHRKLSQVQLAEAARISQAYLVLNATDHGTTFAAKLDPTTKFHLFETLKKCMTQGGPRKYANPGQTSTQFNKRRTCWTITHGFWADQVTRALV